MRVSAVILLAFLSIDLPMVSLYFYKFTKVTCEVSEQKTCSNKFCYLSTSEKSESLASFGCTLTRPITSLNFTLQQFFKTGNVYRQILETPTVDWSVLLSGKKINPFYNKIINIVEKSSPNLFRKFPWTGNFEVHNLSLGVHESFVSMFPKGVYKSVSWFGDEQDEYVFKSVLVLELGRY